MRQLIARLRTQKHLQKKAVSQARRRQQAVKRYQQRQGNKVAEQAELLAVTQKAQADAEAKCKTSSQVSVNHTSPFAFCQITEPIHSMSLALHASDKQSSYGKCCPVTPAPADCNGLIALSTSGFILT